jgi:hypothetical protein
MPTFIRKLTSKNIWLAAFVLLLFFSLVYRNILDHPNQFLVSGGDGMKNYYTFMYHIAQDSSYMGFEGMNYPFGENIIFTDNQPLFANAVKWLSHVFPGILCYLPAIHNLALLGGVILGAFGLYLCFLKRGVAAGFALIATAGLMLMHPQADRIHGHFALFYPVLPWLFLLWLSIFEKGIRWRYDVIIGTIILCSGLLHMYYFITGSILSVLGLFMLSLDKDKKPTLLPALRCFMIQIVVPFIVLYQFTSRFHVVTDRPSDPWGFFSFHSAWEGLFFSYRLPLFNLINTNLISVRELDVEGKYYMGILAVVFVLWQLGNGGAKVVKSIIGKAWPSGALSLALPGGRNQFLWGIFILSALISFGYPFTISGLEGMLDFTGPFKQFRSIGRVAWISFYAINLLAIPTFYTWWTKWQQGPKKTILYFALPGIALAEGVMMYYTKPVQQTELHAYYCTEAYGNLPVKAEEYQALLPDPYFSVGSEGFAWWEQGQNVNQNFALSYRLKIPTMGVNLSRTSHRESFLLNELVCQPYRVPEIIKLIAAKDTRPLLVVETKLDVHEHRCRLRHWTQETPVVFENEEFRLRRLELASFDSIVQKFTDSLQRIPQTTVKEVSFSKAKGPKGWGYEAYLPIDSTLKGQRTIGYWIEASNASIVHCITEVWQYDSLHNQLDYIGEANRFNYKKYEGNQLWIDTPVLIKPETTKLVIRVSKEKMKEAEQLQITRAGIR